MTREAVRVLIEEATARSRVANVFMAYNENYYNLIPLLANEQLFLAINEDDFIFDGFRISRFRDVVALRIKDDKCDEILRKKGLINNLNVPEIQLESWEAVFTSLKPTGKNIMVRYETVDGKADYITIGKIDRVYKSCAYLYSFDADGIWGEEPDRIPYAEVTSVTFDSRYVTVFSKYLAVPPVSEN